MKKQLIVVSIFFLTFFCSCNNSQKDIDNNEIRTYIENNAFEKIKAALQAMKNKAAFLNQQDSLGNSWLHYAVNYNNNEVVALFLMNGADPNLMNDDELTPLDFARKNNFNEISSKIYEFQWQDWKHHEEKFSAENLEYAIINDNTLIVQEFIANNIIKDSMLLNNDFSPLITALFANSENSALLLIENGANPNDQFDTRSALTMAVMFNQPKIAKTLLEKGADVNADDGTLTTPIMFAAQEGFSEMTEILLQFNANISRKDRAGETAFDKAIKNKHNELAENLLVVR